MSDEERDFLLTLSIKQINTILSNAGYELAQLFLERLGHIRAWAIYIEVKA